MTSGRIENAGEKKSVRPDVYPLQGEPTAAAPSAGVTEVRIMSAADDNVLQHADQLYAARAAMAEAQPRARGLGVAELVRFLVDRNRSLSAAEQQALFASPQLRADFQRLKSQLRIVELPAQAAASAGAADARRFDGGSVRLHPSRVAGQVYVLFQFNWPTGTPTAILLEGAEGHLVKRPLPSGDATGHVVLVLDQSSAPDQAFLQLIADPRTVGSFLL
jgi:hypothetical protein